MDIKILVCLLFMSSSALFAQDNNKIPINQFGIQLGSGKAYIKDLNFSPLNYSGNNINLTLSYKRLTKQGNLIFSNLHYSFANIQAIDSEYTTSQNQAAHIDFHYLFKSKEFNSNLQTYLGGGITSQIDIVFFGNQDAISYFNLHTLDFTYHAIYHINEKHQVNTLLTLPILGKVSRPAHTGWDINVYESSTLGLIYQGKITSLNDFFKMSLALGYQYNLSPN